MASYKHNKALKAGSNKKEDLEYLATVGISELKLKTRDEYLMLLPKWNELHKPPLSKSRNFTFVQKGRHLAELRKRVEQFVPKYAYIRHDKDDTLKDGVHFHFYIEFPSPRSWSAVATDLQIPVTALQKVLSKRGILEYLTHENDPKKYHYDKDDIVTNMDIKTEIEEPVFDFVAMYKDYKRMRQGKMSDVDFIDRYKIYIVRHSYASQLQIAERIYNASEGTGGTCPPFRVPSSKPPP